LFVYPENGRAIKKQGRNQSSFGGEIESGSVRTINNMDYTALTNDLLSFFDSLVRWLCKANQPLLSLYLGDLADWLCNAFANLYSEPVINLRPESGIRAAAGKSLEHVAPGFQTLVDHMADICGELPLFCRRG